jgi:intracellular sulfur oxidation DsrE/DsrF family protein
MKHQPETETKKVNKKYKQGLEFAICNLSLERHLHSVGQQFQSGTAISK